MTGVCTTPNTQEKLTAELTAERSAERSEVRVDIYVVEGCYSCIYAKEVAARICMDFPTVGVRLIDIGNTPHPIPEAVFATPTYLLNDQLWSLGNPSPQDVQQRLSAVLKES